ncbi:hypothetical protein ASC90_27240 [Rhizobium sp. Root1220]|nr:hypothetical protein ASC90_27240 [Rhizobium sp. Root1220]
MSASDSVIHLQVANTRLQDSGASIARLTLDSMTKIGVSKGEVRHLHLGPPAHRSAGDKWRGTSCGRRYSTDDRLMFLGGHRRPMAEFYSRHRPHIREVAWVLPTLMYL